LVQTQPNNLDAVSQLALLYEAHGDDNNPAKLRTLLQPHVETLGDSEGARILGEILASDGDYETAHHLLQAYTHRHLAELHAAESNLNQLYDAGWEKHVQNLNDGKASDNWYRRYETANEADQNQMVTTYVEERMAKDPALARAQDAFTATTRVVPVALNLGFVTLQRAQQIQDPARRQAELESAEKTFLAVKGTAGESDAYRLYLGEVYYWMGKPDDGHKLFDDLLNAKKRDFPTLHSVAQTLRYVGVTSEAQAMFKEAYRAAATDEERHATAQALAAMSTDTQDRIAWLEKANPALLAVRASLANSRGDAAQDRGDQATAIKELRRAVALYEEIPENTTSLNNTALAWLSLYSNTQATSDLAGAVDRMRQASKLAPSDSVVLGNTASTLAQLAAAQLTEGQIDNATINTPANLGILRYLYIDQNSRDKVARTTRSHPTLQEAATFYERAQLLAPKQTQYPLGLLQILNYTRDTEQLSRLLASVKTAAPDTTINTQLALDFYQGKHHDAQRQQMHARQQELARTLTQTRGLDDLTRHVAHCRRVQALLTLDQLGEPRNPDAVLLPAREAYAQRATPEATSSLTEALALKLIHNLAPHHPGLQRVDRETRVALNPLSRWIAALDGNPTLTTAAASRPETIELMKILDTEAAAFPDSPSLSYWKLQTHFAPQAAEATAQAISNHPRLAIQRELALLLSPASANALLTQAWAHQLQQQPDAAHTLLAKGKAQGIPLP